MRNRSIPHKHWKRNLIVPQQNRVNGVQRSNEFEFNNSDYNAYYQKYWKQYYSTKTPNSLPEPFTDEMRRKQSFFFTKTLPSDIIESYPPSKQKVFCSLLTSSTD